jgi:hypothetical protein
MLSFVVLKLRLSRGEGVLGQLGADVAYQVGLGAEGNDAKKNPGHNQAPRRQSNPHELMMNEAVESCKYGIRPGETVLTCGEARNPNSHP